MRPEIRDRILEITDQKCREHGMEGLHAFVAQACTVMTSLAGFMQPMSTREGLIEALDGTQLTEEEEKYAVAMAQHFGHFIREAVTALFEISQQDFPPPPSGRDRVLTPELSEAICSYVHALYRKETDMTVCKQRAAQKYGVSLTTVHRAWRNRNRVTVGEVDAKEFVAWVRKKLTDTWILPRTSASEVLTTEYRSMVKSAAARQD